jgi:hypothetical protein
METVVIIISSVTLLWTIFSFFLLNKENRKLQKSQGIINDMSFISQTQFDVEYKTIKELSEKLLCMFFPVMMLYPYGLDSSAPQGKEQYRMYKAKRYEEAAKPFDDFRKALYSNAPFISEPMYDKFDKMRVIIEKQFMFYNDIFVREDNIFRDSNEGIQESSEAYERTREINELRKTIVTDLREYFSQLRTKLR